jgi:cardiolipin synthase A/B
MEKFADAFAERARAGVKVHFLQDALGGNCLHGPEMKMLKRAGAEVEIFRFYQLTQYNYRTHRKLLTIDGRIGFIGGACIADDWLENGRTPGLWRDTHYRLDGPVVAQEQQAFMDNWMQTRATALHGDLYFPKLSKAGTETCQVFKSSASEGADSARLMILLSIASARKNVRIANAYFIPDDLCLQTLVEACQRGVKVEIITPGADIDARAVRAVGKMRWPRLLKAGARFYEYQPARYHCKYMIVDDCWSSVGSANLDNRSLRLNEEANLNVLDTDFATRHTKIFEEDQSNSREVTLSDWRRRPLEEKLKGSAGLILRSQL